MRAVILAVLFAIFAVAFASTKSYNHYKLVKINVKTDAALADLKKILGPETDIWSNDGVLVKNFDNEILLTPHQFETLTWYSQDKKNASPLQFGPASTAKFEVVHNNIQELIDEETAANLAVHTDDDYFKKYHKHEEINAYVKKIHEEYKDITSVFKVGESWEHREILGIKISVGQDDKPQFFFDGLMHAREWIGAAVVQYAFTKFLEKYKAGDSKVTSILKKYNIVFVPVVNPDGYEFTFTRDRLWRKNRRDNGGNVYGVDLNRNWPVGFGVGASKDPRSIVYQGPQPLSEPETHALNDYLTAHKNNSKAGIDFHSYSQLILRPWSYSSATSDQEKRFAALGAQMQKAIKETHNLHYQNIKGIELYAAGGVLGDQFYGLYKYPGFTFELRDTGRYGFVLPPDQIIPCSEENFNAILALIEHIDDKF